MKKIIIGAPSLTGRIASELLKASIALAAFPVEIEVENLVAHGLSFPEVNGLNLESCVDDKNSRITVTVNDADALIRLASSMEQVAELFGYLEMLDVRLVVPVVDENSDYVIEQEKLYAPIDEGVKAEVADIVVEKPLEPVKEVIAEAPKPPVKRKGAK